MSRNRLRAKHALRQFVAELGGGPVGVLLHVAFDARRHPAGARSRGPWPGAWAVPLVCAGLAEVVPPPTPLPESVPADGVWLAPTGAGLAAVHHVSEAPRRQRDDLWDGVLCSRVLWRTGAAVIHASTPPWGGEQVARGA